MPKALSLTEYSRLIDEQTWAFIKRTEDAFPADAVTADINRQRDLYNSMCTLFHHGYPPGVTRENRELTGFDNATIPVRVYSPPGAATSAPTVQIVYLHGGGFVVGGLDSHDDVCAEICHASGFTVTSVDYRLSPEYKHPAALNDTMSVISYLHDSLKQPIVLCGDSAGANLAAAACHAFRDSILRSNNTQILSPSNEHVPVDTGNPVLKPTCRTRPAIIGQVLIYPGLGGDISKGSYIKHAHSPMLSTDDVMFYADIRCTPQTGQQDSLFAPLLDTDFSALPATVAFTAECDPLCDDGRDYCQRITHANGQAHCVTERGLVHGYLRARHSVDRAARSFARITDAVTALAAQRWPYG